MKEKDILIKAQYGDVFVTRNGKRAIYNRYDGSSYNILIEGEKNMRHYYYADGHYSYSGQQNDYDIMGKYQGVFITARKYNYWKV